MSVIERVCYGCAYQIEFLFFKENKFLNQFFSGYNFNFNEVSAKPE